MAHKTFKKISLAIAFGCLFGVANAAPVVNPVSHDLGTLDKILSYSNGSITGAFDDVVFFKADALLSAIVGLTGLDGRNDLTGTFSFGVGDSYGSVNWLTNTDLSTVKGRFFSYSQDLPSLQSGQTYWIELAGNMAVGSYEVDVRPFAVPEPGSTALLLTGLGLMGAVSRRRKGVTNLTRA